MRVVPCLARSPFARASDAVAADDGCGWHGSATCFAVGLFDAENVAGQITQGEREFEPGVTLRTIQAGFNPDRVSTVNFRRDKNSNVVIVRNVFIVLHIISANHLCAECKWYVFEYRRYKLEELQIGQTVVSKSDQVSGVDQSFIAVISMQ